MENKLTGLVVRKALSPFPSTFLPDIYQASPISPAKPNTVPPSLATMTKDAALRDMTDRLHSLLSPPSPAAMPVATAHQVQQGMSIEEQLFDATAQAKILTSQVAMHLDRTWRDKLFQQLDSLHDAEEWEEGDKPIQRGSFSTFLKAIFLIQPKIRPGLGLSSSGHLIAAWTEEKNRLTIEFLPEDRVRWVVSRQPEGESEQVAARMSINRLLEGLKPYSPEEWFGK